MAVIYHRKEPSIIFKIAVSIALFFVGFFALGLFLETKRSIEYRTDCFVGIAAACDKIRAQYSEKQRPTQQK